MAWKRCYTKHSEHPDAPEGDQNWTRFGPEVDLGKMFWKMVWGNDLGNGLGRMVHFRQEMVHFRQEMYHFRQEMVHFPGK